jgi:hypothetical protein
MKQNTPKKISLKLYRDEIDATAYQDYKENPHAVVHQEDTENECLEFHTVEIITNTQDEDLETCEGCGKEVPLSNMSDNMVMYICMNCENDTHEED